MRLCRSIVLVTAVAAGVAPVWASPVQSVPNEASLRAADARQAAAVKSGDAAAIEAMMHPHYRVNTPLDRVMAREQILAMFAAGQITAEPVERIVETAFVSGGTGVVMGGERLIPPPGSPLARAFGDARLVRRFTNVYVFEKGAWRFLARHFTQRPEAAAKDQK
jgi:hypothetical protein